MILWTLIQQNYILKTVKYKGCRHGILKNSFPTSKIKGTPSAQDSQVNENSKRVVQRVAENLDNCVAPFWVSLALAEVRASLQQNISLRIIKSEGEEGAGHAAAATRPKMSYFRAGIHDFFFSNL